MTIGLHESDICDSIIKSNMTIKVDFISEIIPALLMFTLQ